MGRRRVIGPLSLCLQAEEQGLLSGDLNMVQIAAMSVTRSYHHAVEADERKAKNDVIEDIILFYLKLEHPDVYEDVEHMKAERELNVRSPDSDLIAEDMTELYQKMLSMEEE